MLFAILLRLIVASTPESFATRGAFWIVAFSNRRYQVMIPVL